MQEDIHGHEVMQMMLDSGDSYTEASLEKAIVEKFGRAARFCTCSADGMNAAELVAFLKAKGKFTLSTKGFTTTPEKICTHG